MAGVVERFGAVHILEMNQPVVVGALGLLVDDRVDELVFNHHLMVRLPHIHEVGGILGYRLIILDGRNHVEIRL